MLGFFALPFPEERCEPYALFGPSLDGPHFCAMVACLTRCLLVVPVFQFICLFPSHSSVGRFRLPWVLTSVIKEGGERWLLFGVSSHYMALCYWVPFGGFSLLVAACHLGPPLVWCSLSFCFG